MFKTLFQDPIEQTLSKYSGLTNQINSYEAEFKNLTDQELKNKIVLANFTASASE